jgi:hypothetical protein
MLGGERIGAIERGLAAGLAVLALLVQVLAPPGFMVARERGQPAIVICTGHGPVLSRDDLGGHPGKAPKSRPDAVCGFAGHGAGVTASALSAVSTSAPWSSPDPVASNADLAPGRGLAAPPPPAQAPPPILS